MLTSFEHEKINFIFQFIPNQAMTRKWQHFFRLTKSSKSHEWAENDINNWETSTHLVYRKWPLLSRSRMEMMATSHRMKTIVILNWISSFRSGPTKVYSKSFVKSFAARKRREIFFKLWWHFEIIKVLNSQNALNLEF